MRSRIFSRFAQYSLIPLLGLVAPLLALPIVARECSPAQWAALAIGQSLGVVASVIVSSGWTLLGPTKLARTSEVTAVIAEATAARITASVLITPIAVVSAVLMSPGGTALLTALSAFAAALSGHSVTWIAVGLGTPKLIVVFEVVPRLLSAGVATLLILAGLPVELYPLTLALGTATGAVMWMCSDQVDFSRMSLRAGLLSIWKTKAAMLAEVVGVVNSGASVAVAGLRMAPDSVATYASGDRISRLALLLPQALCNTLVPWISESAGSSFWKRAARGFYAQAIVGLCGLAALGLAGPRLSAVLFGQHLKIDSFTGLWLGVAYLMTSLMSSTSRQVLAPLGGQTTILHSLAGGTVIGVSCIVVFSEPWGPAGAAAGVAIGQAVAVAWQTRAIAFAWQSYRKPS